MKPPPTVLPERRRAWARLWNWHPSRHSVWLRLAVAIALTLLAAWLRLALAPAESGGRFITVSLAAAISALYGGFAAGMTSTVLGMVLVNFFMVEPYGSFAFQNPLEAFWLNLWHFLTQLVVVGAIWWMQGQNLRLRELHDELQASRKRFRDTFEHAAAGITQVDQHGRLMLVNQTFCRMLGYTEQELLSMRFQDFTHPDDIVPDEALLQQTLRGERDRYSIEKRYLRKDGQVLWVHLTVALVRRAPDVPDYFVSVVQDISAIKTAEAALRDSERLLKQAHALAGLASWEADVAANRFRTLDNSHRQLGLPWAEFTGPDLMALVVPPDRDRILQDWTDAIKGVRPYNSSYRARIDGEDRWFSVRADFERDAEGRAVRAFGVTQDVTERKKAERQIQRLNASLEQRIRERTRELKAAYDELESYSYAVAHDLRSPLRLINGFAQALEEDNPSLDGASRKHLDRIKQASRKMGLLIDGLLKLAQVGRGELQRQPVNLSQMATRLLEELAAESPRRPVDWTVEPDLVVSADPSLMEALLQNLLHNAWKYTEATPEARIRMYARQDERETRFCVADNGSGFDMSRAEKLFQPFQRLHQPHEFSGLGIGLATAHRIVLRHGGTLQANSAPGQGATFCFSVPPVDAPDSNPSGR
ncbi:MAG TPA: PAS domain S-box protein [Hydrogenophaga sp.]|uniref:PAS domain S-box protein n=1 Tax=Hydrogenophaga sp. TaxID=1904254 RepID=UPI002BA403FF|nr:PAS domain S-box protein [Hydrogenophaga sp.]HMN93311.1 PAS domain S-box protein [Hydrogenophaga sp.]HMP10694.1 PAS domain S-box protein [Hydrogenophaga sp.]